jgi:2,4-dienoyl-CoA reductase-like NADH-dependent reductase (Old Yellow Enzyme family)
MGGVLLTEHVRFHYKTLEDLKQDIVRLGLDIPCSENLEIFNQSVSLSGAVVPNSLAIHPMEGCDGALDGTPSELTKRRYERFAKGGAGLLWFEATAVVGEGRANPRQLQINEHTRAELADMLNQSLQAASEAGNARPFTVLQLTHSGRNSRPGDAPMPIIATRAPHLEAKLPPVFHMITDEELAELEEQYVKAAVIAAEAGFDAVDIKCCHGYLLGELLAGHNREGHYGGSFENRTRLLMNIIDKVKARLGDQIQIVVRLGVYDGVPNGWGVDKTDYHKPDFIEPVKLIQMLAGKGITLFNITLGNPYYNPHVNRPYDTGSYIPPFHPLQNVAILLQAAKVMQQAVPEAVIMGTGFSWLRQFAPYVAAGCLEQGWMKLVGFGRQAFAYPDFAKDLLRQGSFDSRKICIACSKCTTIMRDGGCTGCVPRDADTYAAIYRQGREGKPPFETGQVAEHV